MNSLEENIRALATDKYSVKIRLKKDVWWQRLIGKIIFFNKRYMEDYSNATLNEIHLTGDASWRTIAHELQHIVDMRKMFVVFFIFLYYSPQILSAFVVLSTTNYLFMLSLLFLAPLPSIGRLWLESRAYGVSLAVRVWGDPSISSKEFFEKVEYYTALLSGPSYYYTMPFKDLTRFSILRSFDKTLLKKEKLHVDLYNEIKKSLV